MTPSELRQIRTDTLRMSQAQVAEEMGITRSHYNALENGYEVPRRYQLAMKGLVFEQTLEKIGGPKPA